MARDALMIACARIRFRPGEFWQPRQTGWDAGASSPDQVDGKVTRLGWLVQSMDDGPAFWSDRAMRSWLEDSEQEATSLVVEEGLAAMDPALKGVGGAFSRRTWDKAWAGRLGQTTRPRSVMGAGTVFTVGLEGLDQAKWLAKVHFQEISSRAEDRRLGLGLAVVGAVGGV